MLAFPGAKPAAPGAIYLNGLGLICSEVGDNVQDPLQIRFSLDGGIYQNSTQLSLKRLAQAKLGTVTDALEPRVIFTKFFQRLA
jgi:hypothetical protein